MNRPIDCADVRRCRSLVRMSASADPIIRWRGQEWLLRVESSRSAATVRMADLARGLPPREYCNSATPDTAMGSSHVIPSATLQRCNTRSGSQFARLWQQLQHFPHRIAADDLRGPTSTGLSIDEIELLACQPAQKGEGGILR